MINHSANSVKISVLIDYVIRVINSYTEFRYRSAAGFIRSSSTSPEGKE